MFMLKRALLDCLSELPAPRSEMLHHEELVFDCGSLPDQIHFAAISQKTTAKIWKSMDVVECVATSTGQNDLMIVIYLFPD
jgi:hypothetical protein